MGLRLNKVLRELNISLDRAVEHLANSGFEIEARPTTKISNEEYQVLLDGFQTDKSKKAASKEVGEEKRKEKEALRIALEAEQEKQRLEEEAKKVVVKAKAEKLEVKTVGKIEIEPTKAEPQKTKETVQKVEPVEEVIKETSEKPTKKPVTEISDKEIADTQEEKPVEKKIEKPVKKEITAKKKEAPVTKKTQTV